MGVRGGPRRIELDEELAAALGLVRLADGRRLPVQSVQSPQEPAVAGIPPAYVTRAPPAVLAQLVEAAVVAHPEGGVGLDVVAPQLAEAGPAVEGTGPAGDHG